MAFWKKLFTDRLRPLGRDAPGMVCPTCGVRHVLIERSFLMSPSQVLSRFRARSGMLVVHAAGVSREYAVGELRPFPAKAQKELTIQTESAIKEAQEELKRGQDLTWMCWSCKAGGHSFPIEWRRGACGTPQQWPYPSDAFFREASRKLIADHGPVVRVTDCGSAAAVRWLFEYEDGHNILVGSTGFPFQVAKVDIDFFPGQIGPEGKTYAKVFFAAAGVSASELDIFGMPDGAVYLVRDGRLVRERRDVNDGAAPGSPNEPETSVDEAATPTSSNGIRDAVLNGDVFQVKKLITQRPALVSERIYFPFAQNKKYYMSATLLHLAAHNGHKAVAELLLAKSAKIDEKSYYGYTPLHLSALSGHTGVVKTLIAYGAGIDIQDNQGMTALHLAARDGHRDVAELLLAYNANVNVRDNKGWTPLHRALLGGRKEVAALLRQRGGHE